LTSGLTVLGPGLPAVIPARRAVLRDMRHIRCGDLYVVNPNPVAALCCALRDQGEPDGALLVKWADGTPAMFVASIYASAWSPERLARKR
jgi:hypothetical protein